MTTPSHVLYEIAGRVVRAYAPEPAPISAIYAEVERVVDLDQDDLRPPTLRGEALSYPSWKRNVRSALQGAKQTGRLANAARGMWKLPAPDPRRTLDPTDAWAELLDRASTHMRSEGVFGSPVENRRYRISGVSRERITISRLDAGTPATITPRKVRHAIIALNATGGHAGRRTLAHTVAEETALVHLHPRVRWDPSGDWVVVDSLGEDLLSESPEETRSDSSSLTPSTASVELDRLGRFDPDDIEDGRRRAMASIARRRGQNRFRQILLDAYSGKCAITRTDAVEALEAAHVTPYMGESTNHPQNGILLRADVHTLWDLGLIALDENENRVLVSDQLAGTYYARLQGQVAVVPEPAALRPSSKALAQHRLASRL